MCLDASTGNLRLDREHCYVCDAWIRLVEVRTIGTLEVVDDGHAGLARAFGNVEAARQGWGLYRPARAEGNRLDWPWDPDRLGVQVKLILVGVRAGGHGNNISSSLPGYPPIDE